MCDEQVLWSLGGNYQAVILLFFCFFLGWGGGVGVGVWFPS